MKKVISLLLACTAATCAFVSCGDKEGSGSERSSSAVVGKWNMVGGDKLEEFSVSYGDDVSVIAEFKENGKMTETIHLNSTELWYIKDDETFILSGREFEITGSDGGELEISYMGQKVAAFTDHEGEGVYGRYAAPGEMGFDELGEVYVTFHDDATSELDATVEGTYTFDEKAGELDVSVFSEDEEDKGPAKVEFDGDKMTVTNSKGIVTVFERMD
ncbi:MAG: hypothetical protein II936_11420 [Oscillospiraceae bacterium]|nr:hypothetical protein [Oscillospiraceae bacterium]